MKKLITIALMCYGLSTQAQELKQFKVDSVEIVVRYDTLVTYEDARLKGYEEQRLRFKDEKNRNLFYMAVAIPFAFLAGLYNSNLKKW